MKRKIIIAAGGTGGHLFPAQQLSESLKREGNCEILFAGHKLSQSPFFEKENIPFQEISSASLKKIVPFLFAAFKGFCQSVRLIRRFQPDVVIGFGSFHSFPVLLAAALMRKKIVLFEANCMLGKVNRLFFRVAEKLALQFPLSKNHPSQTFVPLLPWTSKSSQTPSPQEARKAFQLDPELFTILVFGGSQGAVAVNQIFCKTASLLKAKGLSFQVIHLTGKEGGASYDGASIPACVKTFEKEMHLAYAAADIAVCRSGAGTLAELIRYRKPAILIPFPFAADDHQTVNGKYLAEKIGGGRLLLQQNANPEKLASEILILKEEMETRKEALRKIGQESEGRKGLAEQVLEMLKEILNLSAQKNQKIDRT